MRRHGAVKAAGGRIKGPFRGGGRGGRCHGLRDRGRIAITVHRQTLDIGAARGTGAVRGSLGRSEMEIRMMAFSSRRGHGLQEGDQQRIVHQLVDDASGLGKFGRVWRIRADGHAKQAIAYLGGNVDLARGAGDDVDLHQLLPPGADRLPALVRGVRFGQELFVDGGIALRVQGEFQRLHAVVLRQVGHEGRQGPRGRSRVEKDLVERGRATRHVVSGR